MEVSFNIVFKEEYSDTGSTEYKELKDNLTISLEIVYKNVDGFVGVRILFITKGSVVCSFIVILTKDSNVKRSELKEKLQQASDEGELFQVTSIKVEEDDSEETEEKLPNWALVVMIVLGCLSAVFLFTAIYVCVSIVFCSFATATKSQGQETVSRKPGKLFGSSKPLLVNLNLKNRKLYTPETLSTVSYP